jgi:hypothetical protein
MKAKRGYLWVTLIWFTGSFLLHWAFAWPAYVNEQEDHGRPVEVGDYFVRTARDTFENWQSEFLQLIWQVAGLALFWYVGSPQSKEAEERTEEKLDLILKKIDGENAEKEIREIEKKYPKE